MQQRALTPRAAAAAPRGHCSGLARTTGCVHVAPGARSALPHAAAVCSSSAAREVVCVLDFDGVVVDSEPEVSWSARSAAMERWRLADDARLAQAMSRMRDVRPVLVRGYESMVMLRLLHEDPSDATVDAILADWPTVLRHALDRHGEDADQLSALFERLRNHWMKSHPREWMAQQVPYEGVAEALAHSPHHVYFATSKAGHRVSALLEQRFGYRLPPDDPRLYASLLPPEEAKARALADITLKHRRSRRPTIQQQQQQQGAGDSLLAAGGGAQQQPQVQPASFATAVLQPPGTGGQGQPQGAQQEGPVFYFVEDRLETLLAIQHAGPHLAHYQLFLASWGYSTRAEREEAHRTPGITVIDLPAFVWLLRQGNNASRVHEP